MSLIQKIQSYSQTTKKQIENFISTLMQKESRSNVDVLIEIAHSWMPAYENYTYSQEMENRIAYYNGAMQEDMLDELKRKFPQSHSEFDEDQVNIAHVKKIINEKAKVFCNSTEFYFVDRETGKPIEGDDQINLSKFVKQTGFISTGKQTDAYTQLCHRSLPKAWWDRRKEKVRLSVWPPQMVNIVPDPDRWWDIDSAYAVMLEIPGILGNNSSSTRYEVWALRTPEAEEFTGFKTLHFITDTEGNDSQINENDVNPYIDPRTGNPIYPFVWMQDDNSTELYTKGYDDILTTNRVINATLTDLSYAMKMKAHGVWVHKMAAAGQELGVKTIGPNTVIDIPDGATLEHLSTDLPIQETFGYVERLMQVDAMLSGLTPSSVRIDSNSPESGYALKIRNQPILSHRANMVDIYYDNVVELLRRALIVHNTYSEEKIDPEANYDIVWVPGELEAVDDPEAIGRLYAAEIEANVSTPVDWRMERYGEDRETAEAAVKANAELNKELHKAGLVMPEFSLGKPNPFEKKEDEEAPPEGEEEEETPPEEDEEGEDKNAQD